MESNKSPGSTAPKAQLSCELCQRRKVRCDKGNPCSTCRRAGVKCEITTRKRLPRGRNGGRRKGDLDLKARIAKLENLVLNLSGTSGPDSGDNVAQQEETNSQGSPKPPTDLGRYLGSSFWSTLSSEVNGLREVLDESSDCETDTPEQSESADSPPEVAARGFNFVLCGPDSFMMAPNALEHPPKPTVQLLHGLYFQGVDPLLKILHEPTMADLMLKGGPYLGQKPDDPAIEALSFAVYYAAVNTQDEESCKQVFGEDKMALLNRYRFAMEVFLARADFVNSMKIEVTQAFLIFLASVRRNDRSRWSWTLFALVVRMAQALGLHNDRSSCSLKPFDVQMRRRLWHCIWVLDIRSATDRGSEPIITEGLNETPLPANINDSEIWPEMEDHPVSRETFTEMSFLRLCCEDKSMTRSLVSVNGGATADERLEIEQNWHKRREAVENFGKSVHEKYLRHCNMEIPFHWAAVNIALVTIDSLMLLAIRPLLINPQVGTPRVDSSRVLHLAVQVIKKHKVLMTNPTTVPWRWFVWHQWHALAVAIAELCSQTDGPLVDAAWEVVDVAFQEYPESVADSKSGMLWQPIQKLMKKAKQNRQSAAMASLNLGDQGNKASGLPMPVQSTLQEPMKSPFNITQPEIGPNSTSTSYEDNSQGSQMGVWNAGLLGPGSTGSEVPAPSALDDIGSLPSLNDAGPGSFPLDLADPNNDMAWMNWEDFVGEVNLDDYDMTGT